jgi:hypothetical protein
MPFAKKRKGHASLAAAFAARPPPFACALSPPEKTYPPAWVKPYAGCWYRAPNYFYPNVIRVGFYVLAAWRYPKPLQGLTSH